MAVRPGDLLRLAGIGSGETVLSGNARSFRGWSRFSRSRLSRIGIVLAVLLVVVPSVLVFPLRWFNPPTTSFILQYSISSGFPQRDWTTWDEMSPHLALAVVAAEDQKFFDHYGCDLESIRDAVREAQDTGRLRGASTISQQVAKNLFLWSGRSFIRKTLEAYTTIFIEFWWTKRRILEVYLNVAEFGDGVYGVGAASTYYFDKLPANIDVRQAALLASVLPNPKTLRADAPSRYVRERQEWVIRQMNQLGGVGMLLGEVRP